MFVQLKSPDALAAAMEQSKLTVRELAGETGVSRATIGHLRSGRNTGTSAQTAERITEALGVDFADLFTVKDAKLLAGYLTPQTP